MAIVTEVIAGTGVGENQKEIGSMNILDEPGAIVSATLPPGGEPISTKKVTSAMFQSEKGQDWRVKLSLPKGYENSSLISLLKDIGGFVFPYTPTVSLRHTATYQSIDTVHNNYPFVAYSSSKIDQMDITGDFYCENSTDAKYWIASVHYLRSVTKMYYGQSEHQGAPPPVVKLNGYGDYVFKDVPVVVTQFSVDMPNDVDYIWAEMTSDSDSVMPIDPAKSQIEMQYKTGYAPVKSRISVVVQPLYSRNQVREFSLDKFVKGDYVFEGKGYI